MTVNIGTSVLGFFTVRQYRDFVIAAYQKLTQEWCEDGMERYNVVASKLVFKDANAGVPHAVRDLLDALGPVALLNITYDAESTAQTLLDIGAVQCHACAGCLIIAVTNGIGYLSKNSSGLA